MSEPLDPVSFFHTPDPAALFRELSARVALADRPRTADWVYGERDGRREVALLIKRRYKLSQGRAELDAERQEYLMTSERPCWDDAELVRRAPPLFVNDHYAARRKTDVVIQAYAYARDKATRKLEVIVRFGRHERMIAVFGERRGDFDRSGKPVFSEPEPFEMVPIRYDYAYGGVDMVALARSLGYPDPDAEVGLPVETDFHYPRNPCGLGYLMELDWESFKALRLPQLEDPAEPLTPRRLAVGDPKRWLSAPLPAGWDWSSESWFPRAAYLGMAPAFEDDGKPPAEVKKGWARADILTITPLAHRLDAPEVPLDFYQGASPGMSVGDLALDETFELRNVHPLKALYSFRLPGERPRAKVSLGGPSQTELEPRLSSVVIRPDRDELVTVWSCVAPVERHFERIELLELPGEIHWERP